MLVRDLFERGYQRLFDKYGMGSTVWSPLLGGILTGKYNDGNVPQDSRFDTFKDHFYLKIIWQKYFAPEKKEKLVNMLTGLKQIADSLGMT